MNTCERIIQALRHQANQGTLPSHLGHMALAPSTRLGDLGIDSLGRMSLLLSLMELSDKHLADGLFEEWHTLAQIAEIVDAAD